MRPKEINRIMANDVLGLCNKLFPYGEKQGNYFVVGSVGGEKGKSLKVYLSGRKVGYYEDFADKNYSGDLIDLWGKSKGIDFQDALEEIKSEYNIKTENTFYKFKKKKFTHPEKPKCKPVIKESMVCAWYENNRFVSEKTLKEYKIGLDEDKVIFPFLYKDKLMMYKTRDMRKEWDDKDGKKCIWANKDTYFTLFGWQCIPNDCRSVCIVEGENDVLACYEQGIPALSVPFGGGGGKKQQLWIENEYENLERFDRIYLMLDMDTEGFAARDEILESLGRHNCWIVDLPEKDAGECHKKSIDLWKFLDSAKTIDPEELRNAGDFRDEVWKEFYEQDSQSIGLKMPWPYTFKKIRFRSAEVTIWTGFNGAGKSQVLGQIFIDFISQNERVCIASMEMKPRKLIKRMMRQVTKHEVPPQDLFEKANRYLANGLWLFNVKGTAKADKIFDVFKYARMRYGVRQFLIDSLAKCGIPPEDYEKQKNFIDRCCELAEEMDSHIHVVAHSKKKEDESKMPEKMDVKGTGDLTDMVDNVITIWRNKPKEKKIEKLKMRGDIVPETLKDESDCILYCSKQRHEDWEGSIPLWFEKHSYQYMDSLDAKLKEYLK